MKGLLKYIAPFAPDQSGAVSVLYGLGGIIVICDAGGCTGNICGFDEPRWFCERSAVFSAGLRDMDAIFGRDERLAEKLGDAAKHLDASFAALIGTPVPAVIATDFGALARMAEERTGLPVLAVDCTGTRLYDEGARETWLEIFKTFSVKNSPPDNKAGMSNVLGVIGCTPLDISRADVGAFPDRYARDRGFSGVRCYGMSTGRVDGKSSDGGCVGEATFPDAIGNDGLEEIRQAGTAALNLVVSPAGIAAAKYLEEKFGTPYVTGFPFLSEEFKARLRSAGRDQADKKILIIHQQIAANEIRDIISDGVRDDENIVCGTWFMQIPELARPQDVRFEREDRFVSFVESGGFDVVIGDPAFRRALRGFSGEYIDFPHFAVSGILEGSISS